MHRLRVLAVLLVLLLGACNDRLSTPTAPSAPTAPGLDGIQGVTVTLPAGSVDGLAAAIAAAGNNGTVIVATGMHTESAQVTVSSRVTIEGQPGAVLEVATIPDPNGISSEAALFVRDTDRVAIRGLDIRAAGGFGNVGVMLFRASHVQVQGNAIHDYITGVQAVLSDYAVVDDNAVFTPAAYGIVMVSGSHAQVNGNTVDGAGFFGIWMCGPKGRAAGNHTTNCFVGMILCKVPAGSVDVDGVLYGSPLPGQNWVARDNVNSNNATAGFLVIDDANNNLLVNNTGSGNGTYDIEMTGDTYRFGFLTPKSYDNQVVIGPGNDNLVVKDCGDNNSIIGTADIVDNTMDPCN